MFGSKEYSFDVFKKIQQALTVVHTENTDDIIIEGFGTSAKPLKISLRNGISNNGSVPVSGSYVSTSGSYADPAWITSLAWGKITGAPAIPAAQVNSDWDAVSGLAQILNKPVIPTNTNQLVNGSGFLVAADISGKVNATRQLTINGTTFDLTQDRTWNVSITDASLLTTGTLPVARLDALVPLKNQANTWTGNQSITGDLSVSGTITNTALANSIAAKQTQLNGTGFVKISGTTVSYDNLSYTVANAAITGATKTKVTYDAKGLVTAGADATTSDIAEGSNLYFTDERVQDAMNGALVHGSHSGVTIAYNDASNRFELTVAGAGSGDVVGPSSATDNAIARYNTTTGKVIQDSLAAVSDTGLLTCVGITSTGKIEATLNTEQARFAFDAGSYMTITVANGSETTFDLGEASNFFFNKPVVVGNFQTNVTSTSANLTVWSNTAVATANANLAIGSGPNTSIRAFMRGGSSPTIAPGDNYSSFVIGTTTVVESSTAGIYPLFTQMSIMPLAVTNHANSALTDYASLHIKGTISGVSPTGRNLALWIEAGDVEFSVLGGSGNRMVTVDNNGKFATAALPSAGSGDVVGPASATDNALARYDNTTGKLLQNSVATLSDTGALAGLLSINGYGIEGHKVLTEGDVTSGAAGVWTTATGLQFAAAAGGMYWVTFFVTFDGTATTGGVRWGFSGPTLTRINYRTQHNNGPNTDWFNAGMDGYDEGITSGTIFATTANTAIGQCLVTVSASGNVVLRFSSELDNGITIKNNRSVIFFRKLN